MWLYHDLELEDPLMVDACDLACDNSRLDFCSVKKLPHPLLANASAMFPMNWRFFPTLDSQVVEMASRDLDTRYIGIKTSFGNCSD